MAKKITPKQMALQWATLPNKFEVNVMNFEVIMGKLSVEIFKKSFYLKRFNSPGTFAWRPRTDRKKHPLLDETGNLKNSIKYESFYTSSGHGVQIYADPQALINSKRQKTYYYYAKVQNLGGQPNTELQWPGAEGKAALIPQRQFIGKSTYIIDKLKSNSSRIFNGFPK